MEFADWHRLFGITLTDYFSDTAYSVELEKDLSLRKQFLDVVIIEKKDGRMPDNLPDGLEDMAAHNLLSYKSFRESFDDWSADELVGHFVNYRKQVSPSLKICCRKRISGCMRSARCFPAKLAKEASLTRVRKGVYDLRWGNQKYTAYRNLSDHKRKTECGMADVQRGQRQRGLRSFALYRQAG
ncbi:MAG: hypothetical protein HC887_13000 [Desulfobacteraceae bacterium]|nr:hypothetical protein [Desulfobacteraceae bacterium]